MMKRKVYVLMVVVGVAMVALGLCMMARISTALPGALVGLGAGALGAGLSGVFSPLVARRHPEIARQKAEAARTKTVERQDERNIAVTNCAKARVYDMMIYVFSALIIGCTLMSANLTIVLMLVGAYLLLIACHIGFFVHYNKTM